MRRDGRPAPRPREVISRQLRDCIHDSGVSATALAREAGVDPRMVQRFLAGQRDITLGTLDLLAEPLGLRLVQSGRPRTLARSSRIPGRSPLRPRETPGVSAPAPPPPDEGAEL